MRQILLSIFVFSVIFTSCMQDKNLETFQETGVVIDYAGAGNCSFVIELDNGSRIQPMYYPEGFEFAQGQRVLVEYVELPDVISTCDRGAASEVKYIEELSCAPYVDLYFENYDSLARDPIYLHEAFVDGDCLHLKISYSGGCRDHTIDLARMNAWYTGSASIPTFEIRHDANDDLCEAYFTKELAFDLTPLKLEGKTEFVLTSKLADGTVYNKLFEYNYTD